VTCECVVQRAAADLPQSTTETLFTVSGGNVLLKALIATVTADVESSDGDESTVSPSLGGSFSFESDVAGTIRVGMTHAVTASDVTWDYSPSLTGQVRWTLVYVALDPGAFVAAA
jgi:hypothetical protein